MKEHLSSTKSCFRNDSRKLIDFPFFIKYNFDHDQVSASKEVHLW